MIKLHELTKDYGTTIAVNKLSLNVAAGEIYGFIGPNGAGKTTTIRLMGGILAPTSGNIIIGGLDMAKKPVEGKKMIGFVPDRPFLYEKLTGMEFLRFSADLYDVKRDTFLQKAQNLLQQFALWDWADELIEAYSHGMKQRLIIASALLHDPRILIIDEPMVGLDPAAVHMVKDILKELAANQTTIFISTHTLSIAEDLCHRIGLIHKGTLLAQGTLDELKHIANLGEARLEEVFLNYNKRKYFYMNTILSLLRPRILSAINSLRPDNKRNHWSRIFMYGTLGIVFWAGTFIIFYRVLFYFQSVQDFGNILAMKLMSMLIMTFFTLLLFSNIINCLSHLYLSQDLPLLHSLPVSSKDIFFSRWLISTFDSSWMIVAFSLPIFLSYGLIYKTGIIFYVIFLVAIIFMCLIASALSGILVLFGAKILPAGRIRTILIILGVIMVLILILVLRLTTAGTTG